MTPTQSPLDLEAIEARCAVATPGPWYAMDGAIEGFDDSWDVCGSDHCGIAGITGTAEVARFPRNKELNAEFIAHAREDVPLLTAEVRRLREVVERLPKTADGVPLLLDATIYYDNRARDIPEHRAFSQDDFPEMRVIGLDLLGNAHRGVEDMRRIGLLAGGSSVSTYGDRTRCYSTRAAALAASQATEPTREEKP